MYGVSQAGVKKVLVPEGNRMEIEALGLPPKLKVEYVSTIWELISKALEKPKNTKKPGK